MISRIEEIESELEKVNERLNSKTELLKESPEDVGLQLGIMEYEDLKEDLIRELSEITGKTEIYIHYIKGKLTRTQEILIGKKSLAILEPEDESIQEDVEFYNFVEGGLVKELEYCYLRQGMPIYELRLKGDKINGFNMPIDELGDILKKTQEVPKSISKYVYHRKKKYLKEKELSETSQSTLKGDILDSESSENNINKISREKGMLSEDLTNYSRLYAFGMIGGSVRVILTNPQPTLNNQVFNDNEILTDTFTIFKDLVHCGDNKEAIEQEIEKIGNVEPITKYANFLNTLYKYDIDVEFSGKTKDLEDFNIFKIDHKEANKIYKAINKKDDPVTVSEIKIGTFRALDLEDKKFKFHDDSDPDNVISGNFKEDLESEMECKNFNEIYKIKLKVATPTDKLKQKPKIVYELMEFLD